MRAAALIALLAVPAHAGDLMRTTVDTPTPADPWIARVEIVNLWSTVPGRAFTVETALGPVTIEYTPTPNVKCAVAPRGCDDHVVVTGLPDGVIAVPSEAWVPEESTLEILIYEYRGG